MKNRIIKYLKRVLASIGILFLLFVVMDFIFPLRTKIPYSTIIHAKDSTVLHSFLSADEKWRMFTNLNEITPQLRKTIVFKEDKYFYYHFGINPVAICRAAFNNVISGKRTSGASTITMQVVRLLKPKKRTYLNKFVEMFRAFQLEWHFSKNEILQMYLNLVPYGGNIEGVKAAALLYFNKPVQALSLAEITALTIIPNQPNTLRPGRNNEIFITQRNKWIKRFYENDLFDKQTIEDAINEPFNGERRDAPKHAPHFSYLIKGKNTQQSIVYTHLNYEMQKKIEQLTLNYIKGLKQYNINNAAVLVVDNKSGQVISYVGSADFHSIEDAGQVDGIQAIRSPGSTLKPLLYAVAFEKGIITPKMTINDVRININGYRPENYDGHFNGKITAEFALANSLNVPAVKLLNEVGFDDFMDYLESLGFRKIESNRKKLGLSVILGGCGTSLAELTTMYYTYANNGIYRPLAWQCSDTSKLEIRVLSEASVFMTTEILLKLKRPDLPLHWQNAAHLPKVAWKTGTSYGHKDAWSIGYNKQFTIGVWVGNFSAEGAHLLSGANSAAPLLFNIFNAIDYNIQQPWFKPPKSIDFRIVCNESGLPPNYFCTNTSADYFIAGKSPARKCTHLKTVLISPDSTISYCTSCVPISGYVKAEYPNYSQEIISYLDENMIKYSKVPAHNIMCERIFKEDAPVITSPITGVDYYVNQQDSSEIMLACQAAANVDSVYWYINDKFYATVSPELPIFFIPKTVSTKISCADDKGRSTNVTITAKFISF